MVNVTGWSVIEYGTLWQDVGHNMGEDPVADTLLRVEGALTQNLPADELPSHPSHVEFPGEVPANATRISRTVEINGNQTGLPSNFGYSQARSHIRMTTGLYAAPGEVVTVTLPLLQSTRIHTFSWVLIVIICGTKVSYIATPRLYDGGMLINNTWRSVMHSEDRYTSPYPLGLHWVIFKSQYPML